MSLWLTGLLICAASEAPWDTYVRLWNHELARTWEAQATAIGWCHQSYFWGDPNGSDLDSDYD